MSRTHAAHRNGRRVVSAPDPLAMPPQNLEAERQVLSAIMIDNSVLAKVREILRPTDFFRADHQVVYRAMLSLADDGKPVETVSLVMLLEAREDFARMGGDDLITEIAGAAPHAVNARHHADIVRELSTKRRFIEELEEAATAARRGNTTSEDLIRTARERLEGIAADLSADSPKAILTCMANVEEEEVEWDWEGRIPRGMVSLIFGDPDLGKSFLTMDYAARVSAGTARPGESPGDHEPGSVIILAAEDSVAHTIKPRLRAAGADLKRVHLLESVRHPDGMLAPFSLKTDVPKLEWALRQFPDVRLVTIDPITAYIGGANGDKDSDVRTVVGPLKDLAERYHVAIVAVAHMNKGVSNAKALYRVLGSIAFVGIVRASFLVAQDKDDPDRRLFLCNKMNPAPKPQGLAFQIDRESRRVVWEEGTIRTTADEALQQITPEKVSRSSEAKREKAVEWLIRTLSKGPILSEELFTMAAVQGYTRKLLFDIKKDDPRFPARKAGISGPWSWEYIGLPVAPTPDDDPIRPF